MPNAEFCTDPQIEHHDGCSSGFFANKVLDKHPRVLTKQGLHTVLDATEAYMVEVVVEDDM
jgi:hypothetical protein